MAAKNSPREYSFPPLADIESAFRSLVDEVFNQVFLMSRRGGTVRFTVFILGGLALWILFDLASHPLVFWGGFMQSIGQLLTFFLYPDPINVMVTSFFKIFIYGALVLQELIVNLFRGDVLRHVLAVGVPIFIAVRIATAYLADIFELDDESIASRFITGSAFSTTYHRMMIENGDVAEKDLSSPILRVGGPGWIQVNLENVAVFERRDGTPHLVGPTKGNGNVETIRSFERLREVIDLREQFLLAKGLSVEGRTRDGIPLTVQNVRIQYSVLRDPQAPKNELSFDKEGIEHLVYGRGRTGRRLLMDTGEKVTFRGEWASMVKGMVSRELRDFISSHTLNEFLASAAIGNLSGPSLVFVPRPEIKQRFMSLEFKQRAAAQGFQLNWIDIGSWDVNELIIQEHYDAWKLISENEVARSKIKAAEEESRGRALMRLVNVLQNALNEARDQGKDDEETRIELIASYLAVLRAARDSFTQSGTPAQPGLEAAIHYLSHFLKEALQSSGKVRYANPPADEVRID